MELRIGETIAAARRAKDMTQQMLARGGRRFDRGGEQMGNFGLLSGHHPSPPDCAHAPG